MKSARIAIRVLVWTWLVLGLAPFVLDAMNRPRYGQLFLRSPWVGPALSEVQFALGLGAAGVILAHWIWVRAPLIRQRLYPESKSPVKLTWFWPVAAWVAFVAWRAADIWQSSLVEIIARLLPGTTAVASGTITRYDATRPVRLTFVLDGSPETKYAIAFRDGQFWDRNSPPRYLSEWAPHAGERARFTIYESAVGQTLLFLQPEDSAFDDQDGRQESTRRVGAADDRRS